MAAFSSIFSGISFSVLVMMGILLMHVFLLLAFMLVGSVFLKRMRISSGDLEQQKREQYEKAEALIGQARQESLRIIEEGNKKASEILQKTEAIKQETEKHFADVLEEVSKKETERIVQISGELIAAYRQMLEGTKQQYTAAAAATAQEMAGDAQKSLGAFQEFLKDQTSRYQGALKQQVQEGFLNAQKEINDYRRDSLRKVEEAIYRILSTVSKAVFGKALSMEEHQELVIRSLDEAKKQGFFE